MHPVQSGRVGGWTATQAAPDDFNRLMLERDRRMVEGLCLGCGKKHMARQCKNQKKHDTCDIKCCHCSATLKLTSRGRVVPTVPSSQASHVPGRASSSAHGASSVACSSLCVKSATATLAQGQKRSREPSVASPPLPPRSAFKRVLVCGVQYTTLTWYNGGKQPGSHRRQLVRERCAANALLLEGGDYKSLKSFASARGKELLPTSTNLPSSVPRPTACKASGGEDVKLSRPGIIPATASMRGYLIRVDDARRVFAPR